MNRTPATPEVRIGDAEDIVEMLAVDLEAWVRRPSEGGRTPTLAVPGGSVATLCFPRLAKLRLDWSALDLFQVDERGVAPTHEQSNHALAERLWFRPAGVPAERVHRMRGEAPDLDDAAREYAAELTRCAGDPPRLDYVLLGVGADGHVASLFPGHPALGGTRTVLAIADAPAPPARRLSLALPVLAGARRVAIVAFGASKAPVIREALEVPGSTLPVARVARRSERCVFLLDRGAGAGSGGRGGPPR